MGLTAFVVISGVNKGIEIQPYSDANPDRTDHRYFFFFSLTLHSTDADGITRTGLEGLKRFIIEL